MVNSPEGTRTIPGGAEFHPQPKSPVIATKKISNRGHFILYSLSMNPNIPQKFAQVPLHRIDDNFSLTDFSLSPVPAVLISSIREIGVVHPVILAPLGDVFHIVCGHRRIQACNELKQTEIPARILGGGESQETLIKICLLENSSHRRYSDVEKSMILDRLRAAGTGEGAIIRKYMPLIGLERSKKLFLDFLATEKLPPGLKRILHDSNVPLRNFIVLLKWEDQSRNAAETLFSTLRPGINKWRGLLELADETAVRENRPPAEILTQAEILSLLDNKELSISEQYDRIFRLLFQRRYPTLAELKRKVLLTLDKLSLDDRIKIRTAENFENGEIKVELKFTTREQLISQVDQLSSASRSAAMEELIRIFQSLD